MVKENRSSVKDFHATYSEALQFLVNNFSRWHQRVQAEQERCVGLERTVEQLARQHRALEIQLSQCYSYPTEELSMDGIVIRCPRGSTLGRDFRTSRTSTLNREFQSPEHSDEDDQFFDAQSAMSGEPVPSCSELPDTKMFNKLLILPRAEGVRASATSLHSLVDADESSSASDSAIEEEAELSRPFQEHSPRESAIQSRRVSSVDTPVSTVSQDRFFSSGRQRRTFIRPSPKVALNLWSIIKNGIGKDLTKIPIPVCIEYNVNNLSQQSTGQVLDIVILTTRMTFLKHCLQLAHYLTSLLPIPDILVYCPN
ncbi:Oxysterol-binding protein [Fasciola gigantica]|uniref:Oxysterol-binding protein n=1 Tax=Fasciola gigantica TaxID=46835 RepID=A0A504YD70_FASGI|nr:Oxysterol-binding protein [Fasciola gigantica]